VKGLVAWGDKDKPCWPDKSSENRSMNTVDLESMVVDVGDMDG